LGINNLSQIGNSTPTPATGDLIDQYYQAVTEDIVPRNNSGVPEDSAGDLGTSDYQFNRLFIKNGMVLDGENINLASIDVNRYAILEGKAKSSGAPNFITTFSNSTSLFIDTNSGLNPLRMIINNNFVNIENNLVFSGLSTATSVSSLTICNINHSQFTGQDFTKYVGELNSAGQSLRVDTIGTTIASLTGTTQAFGINNGTTTEYAFCRVDKDNSRLYPAKRGVGSGRNLLSDNNTITLLKQNFLFIESAGPTPHTTTKYPEFKAVAPDDASAGDWYFDTGTNAWNRYNGSSWEAKNAIWLGSAICDATKLVAVECNDFDIAFKSDCDVLVSWVGDDAVSVKIDRVSVAGVEIKTQNNAGVIINLSESADRATGVVESGDSFYYIYIDRSGRIFYSDVGPRRLDHKRGFYHPTEYWRCIAKIYNNSDSNICKFPALKSNSDIDNNIDGFFECELEIGGWDMDANANKNVDHGFGSNLIANLRDLNAIIRSDDGLELYTVGKGYTGDVDLRIYKITATQVELQRDGGGIFDNTAFNDGSINRGFLTFRFGQKPIISE
jgi:hypothetical protein